MPKVISLTINEGPDGATVNGIPESVWERFVENAKAHFPDQGDDAWAAYLSEAIFAASGGNENVTFFMTDVPKKNAEALDRTLKQVKFSWDAFHAYLLKAAIEPGAIRVISFDPDNFLGTVIITGLIPSAFNQLEQSTNVPVEALLAAVFNAAAFGQVTFQGTIPSSG